MNANEKLGLAVGDFLTACQNAGAALQNLKALGTYFMELSASVRDLTFLNTPYFMPAKARRKLADLEMLAIEYEAAIKARDGAKERLRGLEPRLFRQLSEEVPE